MEIEELSDAQWLIYMAKKRKPFDIYESKAWTLTAEILYSNNLFVVYDTYEEAKAAGDFEEASSLLEKMLNMQVNEGGKLAKEVNNFISSLIDENDIDSTKSLYRKFYGQLPKDLKKSIILHGANNTEDIEKYASTMLTLFDKFPDSIESHGMELLEKLMDFCSGNDAGPKTDKMRQLLVCEVTPFVLRERLSFRKETLINLIKYTIEYSIKTMVAGDGSYHDFQRALSTLPSASHNNHGSGHCDQDETSNAVGSQSGELLRNIFQAVGSHLDWDLANVLDGGADGDTRTETTILDEINESYRKNMEHRTFAGNQEVFYAIVILFLQSLDKYRRIKRVSSLFEGTGKDEPNTRSLLGQKPPFVLLRNFGNQTIEGGTGELATSSNGSVITRSGRRMGIGLYAPHMARGASAQLNGVDTDAITTDLAHQLSICCECYRVITEDATFITSFKETCQLLVTYYAPWFQIFLSDRDIWLNRLSPLTEGSEPRLESVAPSSPPKPQDSIDPTDHHSGTASFPYYALNDVLQRTMALYAGKYYVEVVEKIYQILTILRTDTFEASLFHSKSQSKQNVMQERNYMSNLGESVTQLSSGDDDSLLLMPLTGPTIFAFCVQTIIIILKERLGNVTKSVYNNKLNGSDKVSLRLIDRLVSHLLVLCQMDCPWEREPSLLSQLIYTLERVHHGGTVPPFEFPTFFSHVYRCDVLEEMAYLGGKVNLELFALPESTDPNTEERANLTASPIPLRKSIRKCVPRALNPCVKEELMKAMVKQIQSLPIHSADENVIITDVLMRFLVQRKSSILQTLSQDTLLEHVT